MITLTIIQSQNLFMVTQFFQRIEEGGMFFMLPIVAMFLLVLFLIGKSIWSIKKAVSYTHLTLPTKA